MADKIPSDIEAGANAYVKAAIDREIFWEGELGVQVAAYKNGKLVIDTWSGIADPFGRAVDGNTLFNVFSVTKAVAATAIHIQATRGLVSYEAPIASYWPEFGANGKSTATVHDALTHRTGIPQMPDGTDAAMLCDWEKICRLIAQLEPIFPVGGSPAYHSLTFGWILGEIVRRTDVRARSFQQFVQDEICAPLRITDLWLGIPDEVEPRVATLRNDAGLSAAALDPKSYFVRSLPPKVQLVPEVFEIPTIRRACIPGVGGIFNARSEARFWALLAEDGELDGQRLLSQSIVDAAYAPRPDNDAPDPVYFNGPMPLSEGGYWLGQNIPITAAVKNPAAICCPGAGGSIGWADRENRVAVAICHNRMKSQVTGLDHPIVRIADAIREALLISVG
jgi:CubicO group peptidase (beta-lactamase class C family)